MSGPRSIRLLHRSEPTALLNGALCVTVGFAFPLVGSLLPGLALHLAATMLAMGSILVGGGAWMAMTPRGQGSWFGVFTRLLAVPSAAGSALLLFRSQVPTGVPEAWLGAMAAVGLAVALQLWRHVREQPRWLRVWPAGLALALSSSVGLLVASQVDPARIRPLLPLLALPLLVLCIVAVVAVVLRVRLRTLPPPRHGAEDAWYAFAEQMRLEWRRGERGLELSRRGLRIRIDDTLLPLAVRLEADLPELPGRDRLVLHRGTGGRAGDPVLDGTLVASPELLAHLAGQHGVLLEVACGAGARIEGGLVVADDPGHLLSRQGWHVLPSCGLAEAIEAVDRLLEALRSTDPPGGSEP